MILENPIANIIVIGSKPIIAGVIKFFAILILDPFFQGNKGAIPIIAIRRSMSGPFILS